MKGTMTELVQAMEEERVRRGLDHRGFSTLLGIHESYWHRLRTGERPFNLNVLTLLMQKLPDITPAVTEYIMRQGNDGQDGEMSEKRHDKSEVSEENHTPHTKVARKPSKSA
jgi:hypothetical protein